MKTKLSIINLPPRPLQETFAAQKSSVFSLVQISSVLCRASTIPRYCTDPIRSCFPISVPTRFHITLFFVVSSPHSMECEVSFPIRQFAIVATQRTYNPLRIVRERYPLADLSALKVVNPIGCDDGCRSVPQLFSRVFHI